jgi:predicted phosphodiesterase
VELGVCLGGWLRRAGLYPLYHWLESLEHQSSASENPQRCGFQAWAGAVATRAEVDIIVTGHTHRPAARDNGSYVYMNSGSCSQGRFTYLALQPHKDVYGVHYEW